MRLIAVLLLLSLPSIAYSQLPEKYKDARWNYLKVDDFEILSLDPSLPPLLDGYIQDTKSWINSRWGLPDISLSHPCMILCFPNQQTLKDLTRRDTILPKLTKSQDLDGKDREVFTIWIAADENGDWLRTSLRENIGRVLLLNYNAVYNRKIPDFVQVGMSFLNQDTDLLYQSMSSLQVSDQSIVHLKASDLTNKPIAEQQRIKVQCAAYCLLIRKELGEAKFFEFFDIVSNSGSPEKAIQGLGYAQRDFMGIFNVYCRNIGFDLRSNRTPITYLTWYYKRNK